MTNQKNYKRQETDNKTNKETNRETNVAVIKIRQDNQTKMNKN
jgi:hypothetical protein